MKKAREGEKERRADNFIVMEISIGKRQRTIFTKSVNAKAGEIQTNVTQNSDGQPLLHINELLEMPFGQGVVLRAGKKPIQAHFKPAYTYMKLERKGMRELALKAPHANLDLTEYLDYLQGDQSLTLFRPKNQSHLKELVTTQGCSEENQSDVIKRRIYQSIRDNCPYSISEGELNALLNSEEVSQILGEYLFSGSQNEKELDKKIEKFIKNKIRVL